MPGIFPLIFDPLISTPGISPFILRFGKLIFILLLDKSFFPSIIPDIFKLLADNIFGFFIFKVIGSFISLLHISFNVSELNSSSNLDPFKLKSIPGILILGFLIFISILGILPSIFIFGFLPLRFIFGIFILGPFISILPEGNSPSI